MEMFHSTWFVTITMIGAVATLLVNAIRASRLRSDTVMSDAHETLAPLKGALFVLSQPAEEQVRLNGPGCVSCDLINDYELGRELIAKHGLPGTTDTERTEQQQLLCDIDATIACMEDADVECFNEAVLDRPAWQRLRNLAAKALRAFAWQDTAMEAFENTSAGKSGPTVWHRPPPDTSS